jgi:hypothetical protein
MASLGIIGYKYISWKLHYNQVYKAFVLNGYEDIGSDGKRIILDDKYEFQVALPFIFERIYLIHAYNLTASFMDLTPDGFYSSHYISFIMPNKDDKNYHYLFSYHYYIYGENEEILESHQEFVAEIDRNRNLIRTPKDKNDALLLLREYDAEIQELFTAAEEHWGITFP